MHQTDQQMKRHNRRWTHASVSILRRTVEDVVAGAARAKVEELLRVAQQQRGVVGVVQAFWFLVVVVWGVGWLLSRTGLFFFFFFF